ncbi:MAG: hypothetical protein O6913_08040, partial [Chloroflexi bacterium]|nr:hypothetical protein [Chloroflexota bacterium]
MRFLWFLIRSGAPWGLALWLYRSLESQHHSETLLSDERIKNLELRLATEQGRREQAELIAGHAQQAVPGAMTAPTPVTPPPAPAPPTQIDPPLAAPAPSQPPPPPVLRAVPTSPVSEEPPASPAASQPPAAPAASQPPAAPAAS